MQFVKPMPFQEAVDKLGSKTLIGSTLSSSEWSDVPVGLRDRAFFSAKIENARFLQRGRDSLLDFLTNARDENGALKTGSRADFVKQMSDFAIREGMGPLDPEDAGTIKDIRSESRLSLIFDTQTQSANDFGYWKQGMDPDVLNEFPAQRFLRVQEVSKPRPTHQQNDGRVEKKTNLAFWLAMNAKQLGGFEVPWGPWGFNSGMGVEDVDRNESEQLGLVKENEVLQPIEKDVNDHLEASTAGLDPEMVDYLQKSFGDQVEFEGDRVKWSGNPPAEDTAPAPSAPDAPEDQGANTNQSPVSAALKIKVTGLLKNQVQAALSAIDDVHDDGLLPDVPLRESRLRGANGFMEPKPSPDGFTTEQIAIKAGGQWPEFTTAHEIGHFLDLEAIGTKGNFSSAAGEMKPVIDAIKKSNSFAALEERLAKSTNARERANLREYVLDPVELWARAYAQFIAEESDSHVMKMQLAKSLSVDAARQWTTEDFAPISDAIKTLFKELGWI